MVNFLPGYSVVALLKLFYICLYYLQITYNLKNIIPLLFYLSPENTQQTLKKPPATTINHPKLPSPASAGTPPTRRRVISVQRKPGE